MPDLVPYPLPGGRATRAAATLSAAIRERGFAEVAEERVRQMCVGNDALDLFGRIQRNTAIAFSTPQLRAMVRRELVEITGRSWATERSIERNDIR
jgi:hypothetical protein